MNLRRHLVPGIALAVVLLAFVAFVAGTQKPESETPQIAPVASTTPESATTPQGSGDEAPEPRTAIVREPQTAEPGATALRATSAPAATATLVVDGTRYGLTAPAETSLKEAMDQLASEGGFSYEYRDYAGLGAFVTAINGRASGSDHYWILYVNGEKSSMGISATRIRPGDVIEWKLEKSY